jgi:hypothetical protein
MGVELTLGEYAKFAVHPLPFPICGLPLDLPMMGSRICPGEA